MQSGAGDGRHSNFVGCSTAYSKIHKMYSAFHNTLLKRYARIPLVCTFWFAHTNCTYQFRAGGGREGDQGKSIVRAGKCKGEKTKQSKGNVEGGNMRRGRTTEDAEGTQDRATQPRAQGEDKLDRNMTRQKRAMQEAHARRSRHCRRRNKRTESVARARRDTGG